MARSLPNLTYIEAGLTPLGPLPEVSWTGYVSLCGSSRNGTLVGPPLPPGSLPRKLPGALARRSSEVVRTVRFKRFHGRTTL